MMAEELFDVANYARYHYIKIRMLQEEAPGNIGPDGFIPTGSLGSFIDPGDTQS